MNRFFGRNTMTASNTQRTFSRLMMTSALVAAGTFVLSSSAMADPWSDVAGTGFTNTSGGSGITNIVANSSNGKASGTGNLDILFGETVNIDAKLFVAHDNRANIQTQILGNLKSNGTVVLVDRNGIIFGKDSRVDVGSLIATTGEINDSLALADANAPLLFSNFGTGEVSNSGTIASTGLVAFVAPTVKNSGVINANLGTVSLAAGNTAATVDLYGDGLVEFSTSSVISSQSKFLSENTGNITGGKIQMTAAAAKSVVDSVVNMEGVLTANSAVKNAKGDIVLSAGKVTVGKPTTKTATSVTGNTKITATQLDLGLTIDGAVSGAAKVVNISSNGAKIAQGLNVVSEGGIVNVAAGTYDEHLLINTKGVTLKSIEGAVINPHSPGVEITADNVTVDGLTFENALGLDGYGIFVNGGDNVTLKNNIINNVTQYGIYLLDSLGSTINNNTINNTGNHGIYALNSANAQILNNKIGTIGGVNNIKGDGVLVSNSNGTVIKGNTISNTKSTGDQIGSGVHILNSSNVIVGGLLAGEANTISNSQWDNIKVTAGSNITVEGNDLDNATRVGVYARGTNGITVRSNDIDSSKMYGVQLQDVVGTSNVAKNSIDTIGIDGIYIYFSNNVGVTDNVIGYGNNGTLNGGDDTVIGRDGISIVYSGGTTASGNKVAHATRNGVLVQGRSNVVLSGNTIDFTGKSGVYLLGTLNAKVLNNNIGTLGTANNINGDGILVETSNGTIVKGNTITKTTSTGDQIGSGVHVLNSDDVVVGGLGTEKNTITNTEWDGVKITNGKNITVEGNKIDTVKRVGVYARGTDSVVARSNDIDNATMYGVQFQDVIGISSVASNTIDKVGIDGINIYFSTNVKVTDNVIGYGLDGNFGTTDDAAAAIVRDGISVLYSAGTDVSGNKVANTKRNGINVEGKSGIKLTSNTVNNTGKSGFYLLNTTGAQILNNKIGILGATNNINGDGILVQTSDGVVIKGNTISKTKSTGTDIGSGVHLLNSSNATVGGSSTADANTISNAEWDAVKITGGSNILVQRNDFDNLKRVGVYALNTTGGLNILNNDIDVANMYGVQVDGVTGVTNIIGNTIDKVGFDGISVRYGAQNVNIQNNVIGYGADGLLGTTDDKNSGRDGISVVYSTGTNIEGNFITNTSRHGIYALAAAGTNVIDNQIDKVAVDGVNIVNASNSKINGNKISTVGHDGVYAASSTGLNIADNVISNLASLVTGKAAIEVGTGTGTVALAGNTIGNNFDYGLVAYSGTIDLTGATNTVQNTRVGLGFYPASALTSLSLVGDTIGTTAFIDQSQYFVDLGPDAMFAPGSPTQLDGNNATYTLGGVTIDPAFNGGFVTSTEYDTLETFFNHYNDVNDRGQFFFSLFPTFSAARSIDQKDVFRDLTIPLVGENGGSLTITGLPTVGGTPTAPAAGTPFNPAAIEPAAGDDSTDAGADVAAIQPAAGGDTGCWADASTSLGQGAAVTFNFGAGSSALLQAAANCGNGQSQGQSL